MRLQRYEFFLFRQIFCWHFFVQLFFCISFFFLHLIYILCSCDLKLLMAVLKKKAHKNNISRQSCAFVFCFIQNLMSVMFFFVPLQKDCDVALKMNKVNYQNQLDALIARHVAAGETPSLLLHSCCAPCSSYVLEYLSRYFNITLYYYNPNISPESEYRHRVEEQKRLIASMPTPHPVSFLEGEYVPSDFFNVARGMENAPEGGRRCMACYRLRLEHAALVARDGGFDYFTTTLSISPLKRAERINEIGTEVAARYGVAFLPSDFKKRGGYLRSIELSREYGLYRQNFCGCVFSRQRNKNSSDTDVVV